jgi:hypothetical protein
MISVLRFEQVLEMVEENPVFVNEIFENFEGIYTKNHIDHVMSRMIDKGYIEIDQSKVYKKKDLCVHAF